MSAEAIIPMVPRTLHEEELVNSGPSPGILIILISTKSPLQLILLSCLSFIYPAEKFSCKMRVRLEELQKRDFKNKDREYYPATKQKAHRASPTKG
jgi:hypothetical protein